MERTRENDIARFAALTHTFENWLFSIRCVRRCKIMSAKETAAYVESHRCSLIRFGDGEFFLMDGFDIHYQKCSDQLREELVNILSDFTRENGEKRYLLCMPKWFFECSGFELLRRRVYIRSWVRPRYLFKKRWDKKAVRYGDAFLFSEGNRQAYSHIWADESIKRVLFVHNSENYARDFRRKSGKETIFYGVPPQNAFEERFRILQDLICISRGESIDLVLLSCGPCAKFLVKMLAEEQIWSIDTGHCWDEPLKD